MEPVEESLITVSGASQVTLSWSQTESLAIDKAAVQFFLEIEGFTVQAGAGFSEQGFTTFDVKAAGAIGDIDTSSSVGFDPSAAQFKYFQTSMAASLLGVNISNTFYIDRVQTSSYDIISVAGQVDAVAYDAALKLGLAPVCFREIRLGAKWDWEFCDASLAADIYFTSNSGFEGFEVNASDIHVLEEDFWGIEPLLSVNARFTVDSKVVSPKLSFKTDWFACPEVNILAEVLGGDSMSITGFTVHGIEFKSSFDNGVTAIWAHAFDGSCDSHIQVTVPITFCCGSPGSLDFSSYYDPTSTGLFGWTKTTFTLDAPVSSAVTVKLNTDFRVTAPQWALSLTVSTVW
ncbi:MAG: hypothetical protein U9N00_00725 [Candidatus Bipolaricaulota bacterium]|nr:hypothetical protein [Candidatus Bipolaricaulota bacterium]